MPPKRNTSNTVQPKPWDNGIVPSAQETWFMLSVLCHTTGRPEIDWNAVKRDMNYASCDTTKVRWGQVMRKLKRDDIKDGKYAYPGYDSDEANSPGEKKVRPGRKKGVPRTPKTPSSSIRKALKSSETAIDSDDDDDEVALSAGTKSSLAKPGNVINLTEDNNEDADDERAIQSQLRHETWGRRAAVPAAAERVHGYTGFDPHAAARRAAASNLTASATLTTTMITALLPLSDPPGIVITPVVPLLPLQQPLKSLSSPPPSATIVRQPSQPMKPITLTIKVPAA
ncbi:hypothetical protein QBC38DRAFT_157205 [Podospora fimiseda]|uniref:Myb-like domain-containing protein n=1 Tax=Podospora fimiseda TaxID=252190 RepID=A0AAN7GWE2_9PEZI|nr:hypothetical protein QBC38DRAFT_157205 [Podospora fimiseda]